MRANSEPFDFVILNELLDDMPCRVYFADGDGRGSRQLPRAVRRERAGPCASVPSA